jgi:hypothetical protein
MEVRNKIAFAFRLITSIGLAPVSGQGKGYHMGRNAV